MTPGRQSLEEKRLLGRQLSLAGDKRGPVQAEAALASSSACESPPWSRYSKPGIVSSSSPGATGRGGVPRIDFKGLGLIAVKHRVHNL